MQVDYDESAPTRVYGSDRWRKPRLFVAKLHYSRCSFRRMVWKYSQKIWVKLHEHSVRRQMRIDHSSCAVRPAAIGSEMMVRLYERCF